MLEIPVTLTVWNFALPECPRLRTIFSVSPAKAMAFRKSLSAEEVVNDYMNILAENRLATLTACLASLVGPKVHIQAAKLKMNVVSPDVGWLGQWGRFFPFEGAEFDTPEYWARYKKRLLEQKELFEKLGLTDRAVLYPYDEPAGNEYDKLAKLYAFIHKQWPEGKILLTDKPIPQLKDYVDIWCAPFYECQYKDVADVHNAGKEYWAYTCISELYPYPSARIDRPGNDQRIWGWLAWRYDLDGLLYWKINEWTAPDLYNNIGKGNGDGYLLYPGLSDGKVNPSVRLFLIRNGFEDYEYLKFLQHNAENGKKDAKEFLQKCNEIIKSF